MTDQPAHDAAFAASRADRDRTLAAIHGLELATAKAAPARGWLAGVETDLAGLRDALTEEHEQSSRFERH